MRCAWIVVLAAGCGRIGFDSEPPPAERTCWASWVTGFPALSEPELVAELTTPDVENDPSLSPDGLTLYFSRGAPDNRDVWVATRPARDAPFTDAHPIAELSSSQDDSKLSLEPDQLGGVMSSIRGLPTYDLFVVRRPDVASPFAIEPMATALNTDAENQLDPELSGDGLHLYFAQAPAVADATFTVWRAERPSLAAAFEPATQVLGLGPASITVDPTLSPDELVIVYAVGENETTLDHLDLSFATRTGPDGAFEHASILSDASVSGALDNDPELSADGCELFFSSDRDGDRSIYVARVTD